MESEIKLDPIYKYKKWRDFFMLCQPDVVYPIAPSRPDRAEFIEAMKQLHDIYGIVHFVHDYSAFMRIDPVRVANEAIEWHEEKKVEKRISNRYDDFYMKAYKPEELAWQAEQASKTKATVIPGVCSSTGQHWNKQIDYSLSQEPKSATQSNDLPSSGIKIPPTQQSSLTEPKNDPNIFANKLEESKKEDEDDCEF